LIALFATLVMGVVARFGAGLLIADWQARATGVFVPLGYAMKRYSYSGPPTFETFVHLMAAVGSLVAIAILWRCFLKRGFEEPAN